MAVLFLFVLLNLQHPALILWSCVSIIEGHTYCELSLFGEIDVVGRREEIVLGVIKGANSPSVIANSV